MEIPFQFKLNEDETRMLGVLEDFKKRENLDKVVLECNSKEEHPIALYKKAAELGLFGFWFPQKYGGLLNEQNPTMERMAALTAIKLSEDIPELYVSWGSSFGLVGLQVLLAGTEEHKNRYLPGILGGDTIASFCLTEPSGGSNSLLYGNTLLEDKGDHYLLNGSKTFITNGNFAELYYVYCRDKNFPKGDKRGVRSILVEKNDGNITTTKIHDKFGLRCSDTASVYFDNVVVPKDRLVLGREGLSEEQTMKLTLEHLIKDRTVAMYVGIGIARGAVRRITDYLSSGRYIERKEGKVYPIAFPLVQEKLRPMIGNLLEKQRLVFSIVDDIDKGNKEYYFEDVIREKVSTVEMAIDTAKNSLQLAGGYGFLEESHFPRLLTSAIVLSIGAGTTEIQKGIMNKLYQLPKTG